VCAAEYLVLDAEPLIARLPTGPSRLQRCP
jgi:hypothetical protein